MVFPSKKPFRESLCRVGDGADLHCRPGISVAKDAQLPPDPRRFLRQDDAAQGEKQDSLQKREDQPEESKDNQNPSCGHPEPSLHGIPYRSAIPAVLFPRSKVGAAAPLLPIAEADWFRAFGTADLLDDATPLLEGLRGRRIVGLIFGLCCVLGAHGASISGSCPRTKDQKNGRSQVTAARPKTSSRTPSRTPVHSSRAAFAEANSRSSALTLLEATLRRRRPLEEAMEADVGFLSLEPRDRAFAHRLVATTVRRLGQIDALLGLCLERPLVPKLFDVRDVLRLGVCQLVFLGTPPHAAIDTAVTLAAGLHSAAYRGLVNAVLRRVGREGVSLAAEQDAARLNTPTWLWDSWTGAYGEDVCRRIAEACLSEAPLDITVKGDPAFWAAALEAELLPTGSLRRPHVGNVPDLPGFKEGAWWIQDTAAALPARLLGEVTGRRVADLCAAPGGKTAQLAAAGAQVVAVDRSATRLRRLSGNLERLGLSCDTVAADVATWRPAEALDAVLLDAPCSATGTIRRHPDVGYLKTPGDVANLAVEQARLLAAAAGMVKPGGLLVYCVCSLQPEEGPQQIAAALAAGLPLRRVPVQPGEVGGLAECLTSDGDLRTMPFHLADKGGMDAFYAARLQRV